MTEWKKEFGKKLEGLGDYWKHRHDKANAFFKEYGKLLEEIESACGGPIATIQKGQVIVQYYTNDGKQTRMGLESITVRIAERAMAMSPQIGFENGKSIMRAVFSVAKGSVVGPRNSLEFVFEDGNAKWAIIGKNNKPETEFKPEMLGELLSFALIPEHPKTA